MSKAEYRTTGAPLVAAYRETILLPSTDFPQRANLPALEREVQTRWEGMDLYRRIREARAGSPKWVLHDGPPYANGDVHVGTGQNKVLKDIVVRFRTMAGFDSPYVPGWDCHGLPIEHRILKELGAAAMTTGAPEIRRRCEEYARGYVNRQRRQFKALGVSADWSRPYLTLSKEYELGVIEAFEALVDRGHVYRGRKAVKWCAVDRTALAEAEVEYRRLRSPSIYFHVPLHGMLGGVAAVDLLVWTTTPWTLPGNVAIAVHPALEYILCRRGARAAVVARARYDALASRLGLGEVLATFRGADLEGRRYGHPLWDHPCPVVPAAYVTAGDGTGLVHTAPAHGEEDFETGQVHGLPTVSLVDEAGVFTADAREWAGRFVFDADPLIVEALARAGRLAGHEQIEHEYPCCWRCKSALIHRATPQWFVSLEAHAARARALAAVAATRWVPAWGATRMSAMLRERPDWCISRQRAWGVPIPAFYCTACQEPHFDFAAVKALVAKGGAGAWFTTVASGILPPGTRCACGGADFRKETDIFDVWFESGASHRSVLMRDPELAYPADLYLEGTDQHRGWFQSSLLESVLAGHAAPFRTVVTNGFLVDARTGDKLSKSGFLIPAEEVAQQYGADLFRLWIASIDYTEDIPFSREILEARAPYYAKIRNTFRYLLGNLSDFDVARDSLPYGRLAPLDRWALNELGTLIEGVRQDFEAYAFHNALQRLYRFAVVTMSALYLDVLKDRLYTMAAASPARRSAQTALHAILDALVRLYAPVLVHTCEEVWDRLTLDGKEPSVHLARWPTVDESWVNPALAADYARLLEVRTEVTRALELLRQSGAIGRSLDARVRVHAADGGLAMLLAAADLEELFIVSDVTLEPDPDDLPVSGVTGLRVAAEPVPYPRCERCWARRASVGTDPDRPGLCARCIETLRSA